MRVIRAYLRARQRWIGRTARVVALGCIASGSFATEARADPNDGAALKKRGDEAMESGRPADALEAYTAAYAISSDPALLYNRGRALQALTDYPAALADLERFQRVAPTELTQRVRGLAGLLAELRGKVTTLSLSCTEGARVRLRDKRIATCPLREPIVVNAGPALLEVSKDGFTPWSNEIALPGGGTASYEVHLEPQPLPRSVVVAPSESAAPSLLSRWWFWTGVGVLVAGGTAAVIVAATSERDPRPGTVPPGVVTSPLESVGFRF